MKKTNIVQKDLSIEERKKILMESIENQVPKAKKKDVLLMPFMNEIKIMLERKLSINSQLRAVSAAGIKVSYKTYKAFLDSLDHTPAEDEVKKDNDKNKVIILNDKGDVKTYAVKDEIKNLGFIWDKDRKGWRKEVGEDELVKVKELKVGYDII